MNIQDRMELLKLLSESVQDTIRGGWMRQIDFHEEDHRIVWHTDGTGTVETVDYPVRELLRFQVEVTCSAVEPEVNKPTGFVVTKAWSAVPAGWFVRAKPEGPWYEVLKTRRVGDHQHVLIRFPDGREGPTVRGAEDEVKCRRGTLAPSSVQAALDALNAGGLATEMLEDET